ncbi:hypothetical protein SAMN02746041_00356 [Desulfacinum hydrothermale DSM 13146]|uniref:Murein lipoprotein n=1 Tax=Desulfacinum hydrothermale DSM 13146 TaxID=1121390 RepID=A0A1W1X120_9BACT|nr:hypothetical protein [Desulfacinum hydrothermale]SMC17604.1 hypothetical protein SAMN02746041_00356 [Desulfacinum hydrothermale DSM 13146]
MKRILAVFFVVALCGAMLGGCASQNTIKQLQANQDQIMQRLDSLEKSQMDNTQQCEDAARRAEAAADRAEAMANKCESIFMKHMKK